MPTLDINIWNQKYVTYDEKMLDKFTNSEENTFNYYMYRSY